MDNKGPFIFHLLPVSAVAHSTCISQMWAEISSVIASHPWVFQQGLTEAVLKYRPIKKFSASLANKLLSHASKELNDSPELLVSTALLSYLSNSCILSWYSLDQWFTWLRVSWQKCDNYLLFKIKQISTDIYKFRVKLYIYWIEHVLKVRLKKPAVLMGGEGLLLSGFSTAHLYGRMLHIFSWEPHPIAGPHFKMSST